MRLDISNIVHSKNKAETIEIQIEMGSFDSMLGSFPILQKKPVDLVISNQEDEYISLTGKVDLLVAIPCSRCLDPVSTQICFELDRKLRISEGSLTDEEMEETDYMIGFELDADKLVYAEILVNWPMRVLCREDCRGICKVCGANRNHTSCSCDATVPDPRMAAIQDIFNQFKKEV